MVGNNGTQSMVRAYRVLDELVESDLPMTATELAARVDLHQSTVSRMLAAFQEVGFVRKPDYHHFSVDLGLAVFAGKTAKQFPVIRRLLPVFSRRVADYASYGLTLCVLWRGELVVLLKRDPHGEFHLLPSCPTPLHLSVAALRHLVELPRAEALAQLRESRRQYGWGRPTANVPANPSAALRAAREAMQGNVLTLTDWAGPRECKAAIPVRRSGEVVATLVLYALDATAGHDLPIDLLQDLAEQARRVLAQQSGQAHELMMAEGMNV